MSSISENVDDRLSMLPEEILSLILSLLPMKFAVQTSILSKRWRYTWTLVTNLDFDDTHVHPSNKNIFTEFVDRVFKFCKPAHVKLFRLHISKNQAPGSNVSQWIDNVIRLNVRELDIRVNHPKLPLSFSTCKTLTKLRLDLSICFYEDCEFPSPIYLPFLKTLDIVGSDSPRFNIFDFINGCPMLENLAWEVSNGRIKYYIFNIPTLKRLKLKSREVTPCFNSEVVLRVPKLEYLYVCGELCWLFVMEDVLSLIAASVACWGLRGDLLDKLSGVQNLAIQYFPFTSSLPIFRNMKQLELISVWQSGQITQFLESCPKLKILCIEAVIKQGRNRFKPPACMRTNLTTIKFSICVGDSSDMDFIKYMLGNAHVLKAVDISFVKGELPIKDSPGFCAKVLKLPRASPHCEIHFNL